MEIVVANVDKITFDIELQLDEQVGAQPLPFQGMDTSKIFARSNKCAQHESTSALCLFFKVGNCVKGSQCPFRHVRGDRTVVCKHWLRGLCKKGDLCEFLHEYDMTKMPECYFYSKFNACHNKECPFLHISADMKMKDCPWYDRGFCRHGPLCRNRHVRRVLCMNYFAGFCPEGPECKFRHPRFELPQLPPEDKHKIVCHACGEAGHKATNCYKGLPRNHSFTPRTLVGGKENTPTTGTRANLFYEHIICYRCNQKGHYASQCSQDKSY